MSAGGNHCRGSSVHLGCSLFSAAPWPVVNMFSSATRKLWWRCDVLFVVLIIHLGSRHLLRCPDNTNRPQSTLILSFYLLPLHDKTRRLIRWRIISFHFSTSALMHISLTHFYKCVWINLDSTPLAVNKHGWHRLPRSGSCAAMTDGCHKLCSKEHTSILDIKHLAVDPVGVTQWANCGARIKADPADNVANLWKK